MRIPPLARLRAPAEHPRPSLRDRTGHPPRAPMAKTILGKSSGGSPLAAPSNTVRLLQSLMSRRLLQVRARFALHSPPKPVVGSRKKMLCFRITAGCPSCFEGWDSTVVSRVGFHAAPAAPSFIYCTDDPITHPFRKVP